MSSLAERIRAASRRPASLGTTPDGVISLAMGEPFFPTPAPIVQSAIAALRRGRTRYEALTGSPELREALAQHLSSDAARDLDPRQVVITHGASAGLAATILALVDPGDRVLIPEPTYSLYADHVAMAGGEPVWVRGFDLDRIEQELPRARLVIVCNPNNPTGAVLGREELTALAELVNASDAYLLLDEAYADIVFDGPFHSGLQLPTDRVVCCGTFSKTFAMTGWRIGHVVAPVAVADEINLVHRSLNGAVNTFVQDAALAALPLRQALAEDAVVAYRKRRDLVVERLSGLPGVSLEVPHGAFYAFPKVRSGLSAEEMTARLAAGGVLVRAGSEYGPSGEGHLRLSYATSLELLDEGLNRLCAVLNEGGTP